MLTPNAFVDPDNVGIEPKFIILSRSVQNLWRVEFFEITTKYAYLDVILFSRPTNKLGVRICMYYVGFKSYGLKAKIGVF